MAVIRKIKLPSEAAARDIGALSSNVIYDGDSGVTTTLNDKIQSIFTAIGNINSFEIAIVSELPVTGDDHTIYFVPESEGSTTHNEYMYVGDQWELIGTTTIDLSNYLQKTDIADWAKAATKPTYTANEVGAVPKKVGGLTGGQNEETVITNAGDHITLQASGDNPSTAQYIKLSVVDSNQYSAGSTLTLTHNEITVNKDPSTAYGVATKGYVDNKVAGISVPTISAASALTTGITTGTVTINGTTTTFYAPEDTKVKQNDITGSTETLRFPLLLSSQGKSSGTITDETIKSDNFTFLPSWNALVVTGNGTQMNGIIGINDSKSNHNLVKLFPSVYGTSTTPGVAVLQLGNQYSTADGDGNSKGGLVILGEGNYQNVVYALDNRTTGGSTYRYTNYLPMVNNAVLAAGVTTGVGSSTVPVYMAAGGELLACTLPTPTTYTMSMTGPTINLLADGVAASTITLPIWDGTLD